MSETEQVPASAAEIEEVIQELEAYRQRIINDAVAIAKKVKIPKKVAIENLKQNPEIIKIEAALQELRPQHNQQSTINNFSITSVELSDKVKDLITKARIVSFATWESSHPPEYIQIFQLADDESRYLTDRDLEKIHKISSSSPNSRFPQPLTKAKFLRDNATDIVAEARAKVLTQYPNLTSPGGDLYPPARAEACWRDFWHFLRCITYGVTGENTQFTSEEGLKNMELLYQELGVPLDAMVLGLESLKTASLNRLPDHQDGLSPYFDHLISKLKSFN